MFDGDVADDVITMVMSENNELNESIATISGGRTDCVNKATMQLKEEVKGGNSLF